MIRLNWSDINKVINGNILFNFVFIDLGRVKCVVNLKIVVLFYMFLVLGEIKCVNVV